MEPNSQIIVQSLVEGTTDTWQTIGRTDQINGDAASLKRIVRGSNPPQLPPGQYRIIYIPPAEA